MALGSPLLYPSTAGARPSFGHIELKIAGFPFVGFKKIDYSRTRTREKVRGAHPDPLGKSLGENDYKAAAELYLPEFQLFIAQLRAQNILTGYGDIFFDVTVTTNATGFAVVTDTIRGCTIDTTEASNQQGTSSLTRVFDLDPLKILFNGIDDVTTPLDQANVFMSVLAA